jgi:hypothetical protein
MQLLVQRSTAESLVRSKAQTPDACIENIFLGQWVRDSPFAEMPDHETTPFCERGYLNESVPCSRIGQVESSTVSRAGRNFLGRRLKKAFETMPRCNTTSDKEGGIVKPVCCLRTANGMRASRNRTTHASDYVLRARGNRGEISWTRGMVRTPERPSGRSQMSDRARKVRGQEPGDDGSGTAAWSMAQSRVTCRAK